LPAIEIMSDLKGLPSTPQLICRRRQPLRRVRIASFTGRLHDGFPTRRVLISGAGIAGPVVAYWLGRAGIRSTLVERAPSLRTRGQTLDIHGVARDVIVKMGLDSAIRNAGTHEAGTHFVDHSDRVCASFPVGKGMTNEIEVIRHRLATIFYEASKDSTEYIFGDSIKSIEESRF
jgi:2-polyprenyl-6-methoxyphenol hydroxylase-like FAD-dependent oxidoreductase